MDLFMVMMMASFSAYYLETHRYILMVRSLDLIKASNWDILMVKCLALYF